jgi:hypothetical protein
MVWRIACRLLQLRRYEGLHPKPRKRIESKSPLALRGAIEELYTYAADTCTPDRPCRGIVYRVVSDEERLAIRYKLQNFLGMKRQFRHAVLTSRHIHGPASQSSTCNPATLPNSRQLWVTTARLAVIAIAAIIRSLPPMGVPIRSRSARIVA